jgi:hypothetical protein
MISIEKCREILEDKDLTDEETVKIRNTLYELAELSLECYFKEIENKYKLNFLGY